MLPLLSYPDEKHLLFPKMILLACMLSRNHSACKILVIKFIINGWSEGTRSNMDSHDMWILRDSFGTVLNGILVSVAEFFVYIYF